MPSKLELPLGLSLLELRVPRRRADKRHNARTPRVPLCLRITATGADNNTYTYEITLGIKQEARGEGEG
jgi:hypothetical protein